MHSSVINQVFPLPVHTTLSLDIRRAIPTPQEPTILLSEIRPDTPTMQTTTPFSDSNQEARAPVQAIPLPVINRVLPILPELIIPLWDMAPMYQPARLPMLRLSERMPAYAQAMRWF